jgi:pimeloyl-ACP methyl ester carboxylesterase
MTNTEPPTSAAPDRTAGRDIILIAGLWLDGSVWDSVGAALRAHGHRPVPLALPGAGDGRTDATLEDQIDAVVAAVDAADRPVVVGHSAATSLAWIAADRRPESVTRAVLIGGFPAPNGQRYADFFPVVDGAMPFPGWEPFAGPDSADLDRAARTGLAARTIPVPQGVAHGIVGLADERRFDVPVTVLCPEFDPDQARAWIAAGEGPELAAARHVSFVDIDSGHWPMISKPDELARLLDQIAGEARTA